MMRLRAAAAAGLVLAAIAAPPAHSAELPEIKVTAANPVPECATPGRLMAFLEGRNKRLDARFAGVATEYMRHGETLGLRWDIAFFQMMMETGNLAFTGDVRSDQNNFAGLGATGGGARGESFKDITSGVLAHLQHVLLYTGARIESPVAERTRKVQSWGVIQEWYGEGKGARTFGQLAKRWAPGSSAYPRDIAAIADAFYKTICGDADPHPEWVQEARGGAAAPETPAVAAVEPEAGPPAANEPVAPPADDSPPVAERTPEPTSTAALPAQDKPKPSVKLLNERKTPPTPPGASDAAAPPPAGDAPAAPASAAPEKTFETAGAADAARQGPQAPAAAPPSPPAASASPCKVWTASYGGNKAIIIKATSDKTINYTVLDVNDGREKREADAYIAAYAKGGQAVGEFPTQTEALDKAFELCPEG